MALAAATLSNGGELPVPRLVMSVDTPQAGWVMLPVLSDHQQALTVQAANNTAEALANSELPIWQVVAAGEAGAGDALEVMPGYSWYIGGTLPEWQGVPLALAVILEANNPQGVLELGHSLLRTAMHP
jgi:hypothetical protein